MSVISGSARFTLDGKTIFHSTSSSLSLARALKERATKDTNGTEVAKGIKSWSASGEQLGVLELPPGVTDSEAFAGLFEIYNDDTDTLIDWEFVPKDTTGLFKYSGKCILTALEISLPNEEDATSTYAVTGSGVIEKTTIA
jgi:predicted secreted protein